MWGDLLTSMMFTLLCTLPWTDTRQETRVVPAPAPFLSPWNNWFIKAVCARAFNDPIVSLSWTKACNQSPWNVATPKTNTDPQLQNRDCLWSDSLLLPMHCTSWFRSPVLTSNQHWPVAPTLQPQTVSLPLLSFWLRPQKKDLSNLHFTACKWDFPWHPMYCRDSKRSKKKKNHKKKRSTNSNFSHFFFFFFLTCKRTLSSFFFFFFVRTKNYDCYHK